jgi:signal peptidase
VDAAKEKRGNERMSQQKEKATTAHKVLTIIGTVLCIILIPILIINCILIVQSFTSDEVPSVAGTLPLIVLTDSMYPVIESGDLIICHTEQPENIQVGDVIAFFDPAGNGSSIVTHRVIEVTEQNGEIAWRTKGDNNNTEDRLPVVASKLVAVYEGTRLAGFGNVALFMQSTPGLIICVVCPIMLLVGYDMLRRRLYEKSNKKDTDQLMAELEELRRLKAEKEQQEQNQ